MSKIEKTEFEKLSDSNTAGQNQIKGKIDGLTSEFRSFKKEFKAVKGECLDIEVENKA